MKTYFVNLTDGFIKCDNAQDAIDTMNETKNAINAVEIETDQLPDDCTAEDVIMAADDDCKTTIATK
jgi:hypothetical protein